jgi:hypothetical protein
VNVALAAFGEMGFLDWVIETLNETLIERAVAESRLMCPAPARALLEGFHTFLPMLQSGFQLNERVSDDRFTAMQAIVDLVFAYADAVSQQLGAQRLWSPLEWMHDMMVLFHEISTPQKITPFGSDALHEYHCNLMALHCPYCFKFNPFSWEIPKTPLGIYHLVVAPSIDRTRTSVETNVYPTFCPFNHFCPLLLFYSLYIYF